MKIWAIRIKYLREEKGLTQKALGESIGYDQSRVAKWESGMLEPGFDALISLSKLFGVSADYILGLEDD